jgi:hypothetical protein
MKKSTYYFSHDYNAANDVKILFMRQQLGMEGYGIYWFLIEHLADAGGKLPLKIIPVLAMQMHSQEVKVRAVISEFDLFQIVDEDFFSVRLIEHLVVRNTLSESGKLGAAKRWNSQPNSLPNSDPNAKESKVNKNKVNKIKEVIEVELPFNSPSFRTSWNDWKDYKKNCHKFSFKTQSSETLSLKQLVNLSNHNEINAIEIINQSIANGWKGFFELKTTQNANRIESVVNWANQF